MCNEPPLPKRNIPLDDIDRSFERMLQERAAIHGDAPNSEPAPNLIFSIAGKINSVGSVNAEFTSNYHPVREIASMTITAAAVGALAITGLVKATKWGIKHVRQS